MKGVILRSFAIAALAAIGLTGSAVADTSPDISLDSTPSAVTNSTTADFTFSSIAGIAFQCSLDSAVYSACTSPLQYTGLPEGARTFSVESIDSANNVSSPATFTWTIDTTPPSISLDSTPNALTNSTTAVFNFSATDASSFSFQCEIDGGGYSACTSPKPYPALLEGSHTVLVKATDAAGNTSTKSFTWTIDTTPPSISLDSTPNALTNSTTAVFNFSATDASAFSFQCEIDGGGYSACTRPKTYPGLLEGSHTVLVKATDAAGNTSTKSFTWTIDTTPPSISLDSTPNALTNSTTAVFNFSATDASAFSFQCEIDGGGYSACTSPKTYPGLLEGSHTVLVKATDAAGNTSTKSFTWTIDTTPPSISLDSTPNALTNSTTAVFNFSATDASAFSFQCEIDGGGYSACTRPKTYPGLLEGSHTVLVKATDAAGNTSTKSFTWTIDTTPPSISLDSTPNALTNSTTAVFNFSATDASAFSFQCEIDGGGYSACTRPKTYPGLLEGSHTVLVKATDAAGNTSTKSFTWTIDTTPPSISLDSTPNALTNSTTAVFNFSATDASAFSFQCEIDGGGYSACTSPKTYPGLLEGSHTVLVKATDAAGNTSTKSFTWTIDTTPPSISLDSTPNALTNSTTAVFNFSATDASAFSFQCEIDGGGYSACTSPKTYPALLEGSHTVLVKATDAAGNTSTKSFTWTVASTPPTLSLDSTPNALTNSTTAVFNFSATDASAFSFQCEIDGGGYSACTSPKTYPGLLEGSHTVLVKATDAAGNTSTKSFTW